MKTQSFKNKFLKSVICWMLQFYLIVLTVVKQYFVIAYWLMQFNINMEHCKIIYFSMKINAAWCSYYVLHWI
jgi:hypothetical protein